MSLTSEIEVDPLPEVLPAPVTFEPSPGSVIPGRLSEPGSQPVCSVPEGEADDEFDEDDFDDDFDDDFEDELDDELNDDLEDFDEDIEQEGAEIDADDDEDAAFEEEDF
jgi:hypothetical protein